MTESSMKLNSETIIQIEKKIKDFDSKIKRNSRCVDNLEESNKNQNSQKVDFQNKISI